MADAIQLTKQHDRKDLPVSALVANESNPNVMSEAEFNMLYDNIEQMGVVEPILVRPLEDDTYRVVGGHHRLEVCKLMDFEEVPCMVIRNDAFDDDMEEFQLVRMNVIHGQISPDKFLKMYERLSAEYTDQILQESFGFVNETEFKKLIKQTKAGLPPELQESFSEASKEIKTIDGLSRLLNEMFAKHGDTLPYGYMVFDYGGKESIWLRVNNAVRKQVVAMGGLCRDNERTIDEMVGYVFKQFMEDEAAQKAAVEATPQRVVPEKDELPTLDFLDEFAEE